MGQAYCSCQIFNTRRIYLVLFSQLASMRHALSLLERVAGEGEVRISSSPSKVLHRWFLACSPWLYDVQRIYDVQVSLALYVQQ